MVDVRLLKSKGTLSGGAAKNRPRGRLATEFIVAQMFYFVKCGVGRGYSAKVWRAEKA